MERESKMGTDLLIFRELELCRRTIRELRQEIQVLSAERERMVARGVVLAAEAGRGPEKGRDLEDDGLSDGHVTPGTGRY